LTKITDVTQSAALCATEQGSKKLNPCSVAHRTLDCVTSVKLSFIGKYLFNYFKKKCIFKKLLTNEINVKYTMQSKNNNETTPQEESKQTGIPKWLKNIQENSWELELFISGGAIFSLFKFSDPYIQWIAKFGTTTGLFGLFILAIIGYFAIVVLTLGFCVHLCFRAYWLALVCINYAYPKGINSQKINFKKPFNTTTSEENTLKDLIVKIDRYAGLIMFASVLSIFILIGIVFLFGVYFMLLSWFDKFDEGIIISISAAILLFFILIYILDLLLLNSLRKIKYLSYILFPFFGYLI
jgi:multisubunit Na+/H+ antiporter MnhG subunit